MKTHMGLICLSTVLLTTSTQAMSFLRRALDYFPDEARDRAYVHEQGERYREILSTAPTEMLGLLVRQAEREGFGSREFRLFGAYNHLEEVIAKLQIIQERYADEELGNSSSTLLGGLSRLKEFVGRDERYVIECRQERFARTQLQQEEVMQELLHRMDQFNMTVDRFNTVLDSLTQRVSRLETRVATPGRAAYDPFARM